MASKIVEEYGNDRAAEALQIGIKQGAQQQAIETAIKMLKKEFSVNDILEFTGLAIEEIQKLQERTQEL